MRFTIVVATLLAAGALAGCLRVYTPKAAEPQTAAASEAPGPRATADDGDDESMRYAARYPKTIDLLKRAEDAIGDGRKHDAVDLVAQADDSYAAETAAMPSPMTPQGLDTNLESDERWARDDIASWRAAVAATAQSVAGHPVAAVGEMREDAFGLPYCRHRAKDACNAAWEALAHDYRDIWDANAGGALKIRPIGELDRFVTNESMEMTQGALSVMHGATKYVAYAYPEQTPAPAHMSWHGLPASVMRDACAKIGTLEIADVTFDVERCREVRETFTPAVVSVDVAKEDVAALASRGKGWVVVLLLDGADMHHAGNVWKLGTARVLYTRKATARERE